MTMVEVTASKRQLIHRVAGVEGHVGSLKKMIEEDRGTLEILMQLSAIRLRATLMETGKTNWPF